MINGRRVVVSEMEAGDLVEFGAGGPLLRFGVEGAVEEDQRQTDRLPSAGVVPPGARRHRASGTKRSNLALIGAVVAAMLLGGVGGIVASSRLRGSDPETMSFAEVAALNSPAVVFIRTEFELLDASGQVTITEARTGSGFVISSSGLIVTNRHLVRDWEYNPPPSGTTGRITKIEVILPHQKRDDAVPAEIEKLGPDKSVDVAILKINVPDLPVVHGVETDITRTNQGDEVVVIGYPLGLDLLQMTNDSRVEPSLSNGIVSRVGHDFIQLILRAYHGNSGGPVLNRRGEVIGILTANVGSAQDIALCTPISAATNNENQKD
jgi:S1-C subfamily serine protease